MKQVIIKTVAPYVSQVPSLKPEDSEVLVPLQATCISIGTKLNGIRRSAVPTWEKAITQPEIVLTIMQIARVHGIKKEWQN